MRQPSPLAVAVPILALSCLSIAMPVHAEPPRSDPPDFLEVSAPGRGENGDSRLQDAIAAIANGGTIRLGPGTFSGGLVIDRSVTIEGAGADRTILDGRHRGRVLQIAGGASVTLSGLSIVNGSTVDGFDRHVEDGAGILNLGELRCVECTIRGNISRDDGGGICNNGTLILDSCTLDSNEASGIGGVGGAIYNVRHGVAGGGSPISGNGPAEVRIIRSTLSRNRAGDNGGAIWSEGRVVLQASTISGNSAGRTGGGIRNNGTLDLLESTVAFNSASQDGGGLCNYGRLRVRNSLMAENESPVGGDCSGPLASRGGVLLQRTDGVELLGASDLDRLGVDPRLMPLSGQGEGPEFHAVEPGSPAINAAVAASLDGELEPPLETDQRGEPRPSGGEGDVEERADIGAFELTDDGPPTDPAPDAVGTGTLRQSNHNALER
ncbi:choice-of-anchor Q domain-containing protein [Tautonia rosea]|uniref:choice-of-anchor Q domain-containing protein n=1 Tax=Tautonia rosea TaxID=2728037 RepID=UPI00147627C7|nr:choice-of-anchor Q domain-containing protein [Tautonia rosea]